MMTPSQPKPAKRGNSEISDTPPEAINLISGHTTIMIHKAQKQNTIPTDIGTDHIIHPCLLVFFDKRDDTFL